MWLVSGLAVYSRTIGAILISDLGLAKKVFAK